MRYLGILEKNYVNNIYTVRVNLETESVFFNFNHDPSEFEVLTEVNSYIDGIMSTTTTTTLKPEKSYLLKVVENMYIGFLTSIWTPLLRSKGIIASDQTITIQNTDTNGNVTYLIMLRQLDFDTYDKMAGEFERMRNFIISNGGVMSEVEFHPDIL